MLLHSWVFRRLWALLIKNDGDFFLLLSQYRKDSKPFDNNNNIGILPSRIKNQVRWSFLLCKLHCFPLWRVSSCGLYCVFRVIGKVARSTAIADMRKPKQITNGDKSIFCRLSFTLHESSNDWDLPLLLDRFHKFLHVHGHLVLYYYTFDSGDEQTKNIHDRKQFGGPKKGVKLI